MNIQDFFRVFGNDPAATMTLQPFYELVHAWALRGMGYGIGDHPETSGEKHVVELLHRRLEWKTAGRIGGGGPETIAGGKAIVFDVGANRGDWSAMVRNRFGDNAQLYCFEPSAEACGSLRSRDVGGGFSALVYNLGLSEVNVDDARLYTDALGSGMASVYPRQLDHFGRELGVQERVSLRRLDDVCIELGVARIDLLKLDIEGHELAALRGAGYMLASGAIRMIQFEFGGCNLDANTTFQDFWYLLHERYDLYRVVADGLAPIPAYREELEVYICANFVAVWREK